jgi:ketosteroid isomerase-like protein
VETYVPVAALHYPDARLLPDNEQPASGSQEIRAYWQGLMKAGTRLVRPEARHTDAGA